MMISKRRRDALCGRQSAAELEEEEALSPGNDAGTLIASEILQLRVLEADGPARGVETSFFTRQ